MNNIASDTNMTDYDFALIIPCYNEEKRIEKTFQAYFDYFVKNAFFARKKIALVLVNDGSQDKTADILQTLKKNSGGQITIKTVTMPLNQGKGAAIKAGGQNVQAAIYGFVDADLSFPLDNIEQAVTNMAENDLVIGQRITPLKNSLIGRLRKKISGILSKIVNKIFALPVIDTQCGFKFFKNDIVKDIFPKTKQNRFAFDVELLILSYAAGAKIKTLSLPFIHQKDSTVTWKDGVRYLLDLISISENILTPKKIKLLFKRLFFISAFFSLAVYGWTIFTGYFFSDDFTWLWHGQKINNNLSNIFSFHMSTFYSPVMNAFYSFGYSLFGVHSSPFFIINLLAHIMVAFLSGIFSWQLNRSKIIATLTVSLIALAGNAYEPLVWISANMHIFVTLFVLLTLIFYHQFLEKNKARYLVWSLLFLGTAMLTKETAVILFFLLFMLMLYAKKEHRISLKNYWHYGYCLAVIAITVFYSWQQYLWQKGSVWVQSGAWQINFISFLKTPLVLFDMFFPLGLIKNHLTGNTVWLLWIVALGFLSFILYKFRFHKLVWFGFLWAAVCTAPTIFFQTSPWYLPLASRYLYLPRVGIILIIAGIFYTLIKNNDARYIVNKFVYPLIIAVIANIYFMGQAVSTEYAFVYRTGKTLVTALEQIKAKNISQIIVAGEIPFGNNQAHVVGAASIVANVPENNIEFLPSETETKVMAGHAILFWDNDWQEYQVKFQP